MTPRLQISQSVITRLGDALNEREGAVYGTMYDNSLLVLGLSVNPPTSGGEQFLQMQTHFPTEVDFCGGVVFTDDTEDSQLAAETLDIVKEVIVTDNPLVLKRAVNSDALKAYFLSNGKLVAAEYQVVQEWEVCERFVHVRLRTLLPLLCDPDPTSVLEAINNLQKKVASGTVAFHVTTSNTYLFGFEMDDESLPVRSLIDRKNKAANCLKNVEVLDVTMLQKATRDNLSEEALRLAPVIHHLKCERSRLSVPLSVDHLALVHLNRPLAHLYPVLVDTLCRSLRVIQRSLGEGVDKPGRPVAYHFLPQNLEHFVTLVYLDNWSDQQLEAKRESMHDQLLLGKTRPVLRRGNAHTFRQDLPANAPLINPHETLPSQVKGGVASVVQGRYTYHHYLQDNMQDDGWGCAYRSLQTLASWFRLQGYTDKPIPSHRDIQQCLVDIGDKPGTFLGSRQWIGSMEVSFVLETLLGVSCRILRAESGAEMTELGPDLAAHFNSQGTPIMIGGGVLAHTILGVDINEESGETRFLILDPHYTGVDELKTIQQKGWVGWKKPDFWNKTAFYNMCLPQRPVCF